MPQGNSHGRILRSSSIMGDAQAINCLAGLLRLKVVAVSLGSAGGDAFGLYASATRLLDTVIGLGLQGRTVARPLPKALRIDDPLSRGAHHLHGVTAGAGRRPVGLAGEHRPSGTLEPKICGLLVLFIHACSA